MPIVARIESQSCPGCGLPLTIVRDPDGTTVRYDVEAWSRRCQRPVGDGPLACPWLRPVLQAWLSASWPRRAL